MGLFSSIASFCSNAVNSVKSFFTGGGASALSSAVSSYSGGYSSGGSSSTHSYTSTTTTTNHNTTTTTLDPDRVKAAQIEYDGKIKLASMEKERLEFMKQAQLDIIQAQTESRIAQEEARARGFKAISEAIGDMQERLNDIAARRMAIIERGTLQAVKEAENFYAELSANIKEEDDRYTAEKLPALLEILGRYEEGSSAFELYKKKIDGDISLQIEHTARQLASVIKRQERIIEDILTEKGKISEHLDRITSGMLEAMKKKIEALETSVIPLPEVKDIPALPC